LQLNLVKYFKSDEIKRLLIPLTNEFSRCLYQFFMGPSKSDSNNRLIQLSVIQLSGGHCSKKLEMDSDSYCQNIPDFKKVICHAIVEFRHAHNNLGGGGGQHFLGLHWL